jgi:arylsulfatase A
MTPISRRALLASAAPAIVRAASRKPNIVWIMADDLAYAELGCYGQKKIRTPHIDRLAAEGLRFTDAYAGCTVCAPSRSVLMTGLHMGHTPVRSNPGGVPLLETEVTVAEHLKRAGYRTGGFGKWGLGDVGTTGTPEKHGFDEFYGYYHQVHAHYHYPSVLIDNSREVPLPGNSNGGRGTFASDAIADRAVQFIEKNAGQPFFAYLPFVIPHLELLAPEDSVKPYRGQFVEKPYIDKTRHYADQPEPYATLAGMITRMDGYVGRVMKTLRDKGVDRDTLVFFTSDNGGAIRLFSSDEPFESFGPFRGHKQNLYEGGLRVPMIARWPGKVPAGRTSDFVWMFQDFLATACELAQTPPPPTDGMSIVPTLLGKRQRPHEYLYWELPRYSNGAFRDEIPMQALRMGNWKAVRPQPDGPIELYDLKADPGETKNLAGRESTVLQKVEKILAAAHQTPRPQKEPSPRTWYERH